MAKKNDSKSKPAAPTKRAAKPATQAKAKLPTPVKPVVVTEPIAPPKPITPKPITAKPVATKPKAVKAPKPPKAPAYTREDVALRAYFIAEKRQAHGLPGDEHQDWVEAERQLAAESARPKKTAKA